MKLSLFFLAALAWGQETHAPAPPLPNATEDMRPAKPGPTVAEVQAENAALRAYIVKLNQWYGNSIAVLKVQHDAVVNACTGNPPEEPKPEGK